MASTPYVTTDGVPIAGITTIPIAQTLAGMAGAADVVTDYIVPFSFQPLGLRFLLSTVVATGSKAATVKLHVGPTASAVAVPGCSLALTSANQTPAGLITLAPATSLGVNAPIYPAGTKICLKSTSVTAFSDGAGTFFIDLKNCDES